MRPSEPPSARLPGSLAKASVAVARASGGAFLQRGGSGGDGGGDGGGRGGGALRRSSWEDSPFSSEPGGEVETTPAQYLVSS